jgi:hypothetical protein
MLLPGSHLSVLIKSGWGKTNSNISQDLQYFLFIEEVLKKRTKFSNLE